MTGEGPRRRYELDDAIEDSDLPVKIRHLLHTLLRRADVKTGQIPDRFMPSLAKLAKRTGMPKSTLIRQRDRAEESGWLICERSKGGRGHRGRYTVVNPAETVPPPGTVSADRKGPASRTVSADGKGPLSRTVSDGKGPASGTQLDLRARSSLSPRARALDEALAERLSDASDEEREKLIRWIEEQNPRNPCPYLRGIPDADLRAKLEEIRRGGTHQGPGRGETREDPLAYRPEPDPPPVSDGPLAAPMAESIADVRRELSSRRRPE